MSDGVWVMGGRLFNLFLLSFCLVFIGLTGCSVATSKTLQHSSPEGMVYVPEGRFLMGSSAKDGRVGYSIGINELPQHELFLKGFYIDKYEVKVAEFRKFLNETKREAPRLWRIEEWIKMYPAPEDDHPMNGVSWFDADTYCGWVGKRLPTEAEWEKAARGTDGRQWPWGNEINSINKIRANTQEAGVGWTMPGGSYPDGVSPYGVFDMAGNVMEWTSSWYELYPGGTPDTAALGEKYKVLKGGGWENPGSPIARSAYRLLVNPMWDHPGHGFRCAMSIK